MQSLASLCWEHWEVQPINRCEKGYVNPIHGIWALIGLITISIIRLLHIDSLAMMPRCPSVAIFGIRCPGCGTVTALVALSHGQIWQAIIANPLLVIGYTAISIWGLTATIAHCCDKPLKQWAINRKRENLVRVGLIILVAAGWLYQVFIRN